MERMRRSLPYLAAAALCALFAALGLVFLRLAGAHYDETLFLSSIYTPQYVEYSIPFRGHFIPLMLMTYIGSLKALLYYPVITLLPASHLALRAPALLATAASLWLVFLSLRRAAGPRAALLASALLATDAVYLLTAVFDWGPVALQHLFFALALYAFVRFSAESRPRWLFLATLALGLMLWDKAISVWLLAGFALAFLLILPAHLLRVLKTPRLLAAAALGFLLGAAPFLWYNTAVPLHTFRANSDVGDESALQKVLALDRTFDGSGLLGYLVRETPEAPLRAHSGLDSLSIRLRDKLHTPRQSLQHILLVITLLLAPLLCWNSPNRRLALVLLLGGLGGWILMILTRKAGGSIHHTILLWPIPHLLAGLAAGQLFLRLSTRAARFTIAAFALAALSNLLILNTYYADFRSFGPSTIWTDAIRPLMNELGAEPGRQAFTVDWGISQQIPFYGNARLGYDVASDGVLVSLPDPSATAHLNAALANPATLFITHTEGREAFPGVRAKLYEFAAAAGYRGSLRKTIPDSAGVPIFEIHEFRK